MEFLASAILTFITALVIGVVIGSALGWATAKVWLYFHH